MKFGKMKSYKINITAKFIKYVLLLALFLNFNLSWVFANGGHVCLSDCHVEIRDVCCETMEKQVDMKCHQRMDLAVSFYLDDGSCECEEYQPLSRDIFDTVKRLNSELKPHEISNKHDNENLVFKIENSQVELQITYTPPPIYISLSALLI